MKEIVEADEYKNIENIMRGIKVGNGILELIKEPIDYPPLTVETLYELILQDDWFILDYLLGDRKDLQERIRKVKTKIKHDNRD